MYTEDPEFPNSIADAVIGDYVDVPDPETDLFFTGWYADKELTEEYDFSQRIEGDVYLYARLISYDDVATVYTYMPDEYFYTDAYEVEKGGYIDIPDPELDEMHFDGWYYDKGFKNKLSSSENKQYFEYAGAAGGFIDRLCYPYCRGRILGTVEEDKGQYDQIIDIFWASGACLCVRTRAYVEIGGLDAAFFAHMEEIDLCWRLLSRGHRIVCIPQSSVYHLGGGSLNYENPKKTFLNFRNSLLMIYKNMPADRLTSTLWARFFLDIAASLHYLVTGKVKNAWAVLQAWCAYLRMRSQFTAKRNHNLGKTTCAYPNTMSKRIILFDYYFRSLRTWSK